MVRGDDQRPPWDPKQPCRLLTSQFRTMMTLQLVGHQMKTVRFRCAHWLPADPFRRGDNILVLVQCLHAPTRAGGAWVYKHIPREQVCKLRPHYYFREAKVSDVAATLALESSVPPSSDRSDLKAKRVYCQECMCMRCVLPEHVHGVCIAKSACARSVYCQSMCTKCVLPGEHVHKDAKERVD